MATRDRTWQRRLQRAKGVEQLRRTDAWDRRQILYGSLLILFGAIVFILLTAFNYLAQGISPPSPF